MEATKDINRLKVVLAEKKRTNKWLAEQLGKALRLFQSGVQTLPSQDWKRYFKSQKYWK